MTTLLIGVGFLLVVEGLLLALLPNVYEQLVEAINKMPDDQRRMIGLGAAVVGAALLWFTKT